MNLYTNVSALITIGIATAFNRVRETRNHIDMGNLGRYYQSKCILDLQVSYVGGMTQYNI